MSKIDRVSPRESQSEPEGPRVSQKEFDSGLKVPCSQLIMHDNEMEIKRDSEREIGLQTITMRGRLAQKAQREGDWLTHREKEADIGSQSYYCRISPAMFKFISRLPKHVLHLVSVYIR